jgi:hypothetical protein
MLGPVWRELHLRKLHIHFASRTSRHPALTQLEYALRVHLHPGSDLDALQQASQRAHHPSMPSPAR